MRAESQVSMKPKPTVFLIAENCLSLNLRNLLSLNVRFHCGLSLKLRTFKPESYLNVRFCLRLSQMLRLYISCSLHLKFPWRLSHQTHSFPIFIKFSNFSSARLASSPPSQPHPSGLSPIHRIRHRHRNRYLLAVRRVQVFALNCAISLLLTSTSHFSLLNSPTTTPSISYILFSEVYLIPRPGIFCL